MSQHVTVYVQVTYEMLHVTFVIASLNVNPTIFPHHQSDDIHMLMALTLITAVTFTALTMVIV